jgi:hypothetical protein
MSRRQIELLPLPSMSRRQIELLPLPRKQLVPLPSSRQSPRSPRLPQTNKKQSQLSDRLEKATNATRLQALMRRYLAQYKKTPTNLSNIPKEVQALILTHVFESIDIKNILNNEVLMLLKNILTINKRLKMIKDSLINIQTIDLQNLTITKEIVDILKMTDRNKIGIIMLRDITFDNEDTLKSFLNFLSVNTSVRILELNNIEQVEKLLESLKTYDKLLLLEIINNKNLLDGTILIKLLININSIDFLTFTNNTADESYNLLFGSKIDGFGIDFLKFHGSWSINIIKPNKNDRESPKIINSITANILNNKIGNELIVGKRNDNIPSASTFLKKSVHNTYIILI